MKSSLFLILTVLLYGYTELTSQSVMLLEAKLLDNLKAQTYDRVAVGDVELVSFQSRTATFRFKAKLKEPIAIADFATLQTYLPDTYVPGTTFEMFMPYTELIFTGTIACSGGDCMYRYELIESSVPPLKLHTESSLHHLYGEPEARLTPIDREHIVSQRRTSFTDHIAALWVRDKSNVGLVRLEINNDHTFALGHHLGAFGDVGTWGFLPDRDRLGVWLKTANPLGVPAKRHYAEVPWENLIRGNFYVLELHVGEKGYLVKREGCRPGTTYESLYQSKALSAWLTSSLRHVATLNDGMPAPSQERTPLEYQVYYLVGSWIRAYTTQFTWSPVEVLTFHPDGSIEQFYCSETLSPRGYYNCGKRTGTWSLTTGGAVDVSPPSIWKRPLPVIQVNHYYLSLTEHQYYRLPEDGAAYINRVQAEHDRMREKRKNKPRRGTVRALDRLDPRTERASGYNQFEREFYGAGSSFVRENKKKKIVLSFDGGYRMIRTEIHKDKKTGKELSRDTSVCTWSITKEEPDRKGEARYMFRLVAEGSETPIILRSLTFDELSAQSIRFGLFEGVYRRQERVP